MEVIKNLLGPNKGKGKNNNDLKNKKHLISPPLESLPDKQKQTAIPHSLSNGSISTIGFTPRSQGREATLAFLDTHASDDLSKLIDERDHAENQVRQCPQTKGTEEVQNILHEPSIKSVEKLHHVRKQAEISLRYGSTGRFAYNFSKSLPWNKTNTPRLPSLKLTDFGTMVGEHRFFSSTYIPHSPSTPNCLDSKVSRSSVSLTCPLSPISEPGGWRSLPDLPSSNLSELGNTRSFHEEQPSDSDDLSLDSKTGNELEGERDIIQEARALTIRQIPIWKVRTVSINPPKPK